ncbi:MAG TPA: FKBP-type peptidyl-prolyl cis-trans isomerase [Chitinophagales bacterium]|nr:FKBP-type peptidyl-prolyl cis-trans isomerase [Chitinophagales bacterium]HNL06111.1 FKBP-type peptidyl-prolyl cis-trans isomerase [Chitinophagales bacterium]
MKKVLLVVLAAAWTFTACNQQPASDTAAGGSHEPAQAVQAAPSAPSQAQLDSSIIAKYVADNGLASKGKYTDTGIFFVSEKEGKGASPTIEDKVEVHYKGTLLDGTTFDSSYDRGQTVQFPLRGVVPGWQQGIPLLKEGGKGILLIPSGLAYGPNGMPPKIGPNSVLRFDVELFKVMTSK